MKRFFVTLCLCTLAFASPPTLSFEPEDDPGKTPDARMHLLIDASRGALRGMRDEGFDWKSA